jgi:hypothetical protein
MTKQASGKKRFVINRLSSSSGRLLARVATVCGRSQTISGPGIGRPRSITGPQLVGAWPRIWDYVDALIAPGRSVRRPGTGAARVAEEVQPIFELSKKFRGLQEWAIQVNDGALNSERAIAESTGIKRSTLKSNVDAERMSPFNQEALAKAFGFRIAWPEWHDPHAIRTMPADQRRDTAKAFLDKFLAFKSQAASLLSG